MDEYTLEATTQASESDGVWVPADTSSGQIYIRSMEQARAFKNLITDVGWRRVQQTFGNAPDPPGEPNLEITSLSASPSTATVGDTITITATVENTGMQTGGGSWSGYNGTLDVPNLAPGSTEQVSYSFTATNPQLHDITIGGKTAVFRVEEQQPDGDVHARSCSLNQETITAGETATLSVELENTSTNTPADVTLDVQIGELSTSTTTRVAANTVKTVEMEIRVQEDASRIGGFGSHPATTTISSVSWA